MTVQMLCPNLRCRKVLSVPVAVRGKVVKCQHCEILFKVPEEKKSTMATTVNSHLEKRKAS